MAQNLNIDDCWSAFLERLPADLDLSATARRCGAFKRARGGLRGGPGHAGEASEPSPEGGWTNYIISSELLTGWSIKYIYTVAIRSL